MEHDLIETPMTPIGQVPAAAYRLHLPSVDLNRIGAGLVTSAAGGALIGGIGVKDGDEFKVLAEHPAIHGHCLISAHKPGLGRRPANRRTARYDPPQAQAGPWLPVNPAKCCA